jgi:hypothetical protein
LRRLNAVRESDDLGSTVDSCTYAEISCEESSFAEDLEGEMTQPRSQFTLPVRGALLTSTFRPLPDLRGAPLAQCSTLRELVDDLDWAGAPVCITMRSEPPALSFAAHGQIVGDLKVDVDTSRGSSTLHSFNCVGGRVASRFARDCSPGQAGVCLTQRLLASRAAATSSSSFAPRRACRRR